jgi:hypothetical protein
MASLYSCRAFARSSVRGLTPELKTGIGPNIFVFALP